MARIARLVVPGLPHHVTQRGNRRQTIFFGDDDYVLYLDLLAERLKQTSVALWAYCLMPNHVHLILCPASADGLARALGETHRRYSGVINARLRVTGHLFQARFGSVALDEAHLLAATRYVAHNPVRAGLAARPQDWPWSSARAHLDGHADGYVTLAPLVERYGDTLGGLIDVPPAPPEIAALRAAETIGRPLGAASFLDHVARLTGRDPRPRKRGPKKGLSKVSPSNLVI